MEKLHFKTFSRILSSSSIYFVSVTHSNNLHLRQKLNGKKMEINLLKYERLKLKHQEIGRLFKNIQMSQSYRMSVPTIKVFKP